MKNFSLTISILLLSLSSFAQTCIIEGKILSVSNEPIPFATVFVQGTEVGAVSDEEGFFSVSNLNAGVYNLEISCLGFEKKVVYEVEVTPDRPATVEVRLNAFETALDEAVIVESSISSREETPLSVKSIGTNEIKRNPGGNRDISRAIRALPGVTFIPSFRNDIVIRGGAPGENRFYIDGIEIPTINHFSTQGASGGPVGLINVDLINEVEFYSAAFPANRGNTLSSILELGFRDPRSDKYTANMVVGSSDLGITIDGPTGKNSGIIFSARRSYLQFLFQALGLPFLPTYNDAQFKWKIRLGEKDQISVIGLGAIDQFSLNLDLISDTSDENYLRNRYLLDNLVTSEQWNYTTGVKWDHFTGDGKMALVVSRNVLQNDAFKHINNDENLPLKYDYSSRETENKLRLERKHDNNKWKVVYGVQLENAFYNNATNISEFSSASDSTVQVNYFTEAELLKYGAFAQVSSTVLKRKLTWSAGFRTDASNFSPTLDKPWEQFSPRLALRYRFYPQWSLNFSAGVYYQIPSYVALGHRNETTFSNLDARFIRNKQLVAGIEFDREKSNSVFSIEIFDKRYSNYPVSADKGVSLANLGADFGTVGNEDIYSVGLGHAYGVEFFVQQKLYRNFYGILAYTFVHSEFTGLDGKWIPSSWDSRHLLSLTGGVRLKRNWEIGGRFQFSAGLPYTPDDVESSMVVSNWDQLGFAVSDWSKLNSQRIRAFHQLDIRVDKKWFFKKWSIDFYLDVQNTLNSSTPLKPVLDVVRDANGNPVADPENPGSYQPNFIDSETGTVLPSIGLILEF